jgi:hypothetical protein
MRYVPSTYKAPRVHPVGWYTATLGDSVRFGSVHLVWYEEVQDGWTGPLTSRPYTNRKSFGSWSIRFGCTTRP